MKNVKFCYKINIARSLLILSPRQPCARVSPWQRPNHLPPVLSGTDGSDGMDARHSFPSGHASMSFTVGTFIALYMLGKLQPGVPRAVSLNVVGCEDVVKLDFTDLLCAGTMLPMGECGCECLSVLRG